MGSELSTCVTNAVSRLAKLVTTKQTYQWNQGSIWPERQSVYTKRVAGFHVVAFDYGIKRNILLYNCNGFT